MYLYVVVTVDRKSTCLSEHRRRKSHRWRRRRASSLAYYDAIQTDKREILIDKSQFVTLTTIVDCSYNCRCVASECPQIHAHRECAVARTSDVRSLVVRLLRCTCSDCSYPLQLASLMRFYGDRLKTTIVCSTVDFSRKSQMQYIIMRAAASRNCPSPRMCTEVMRRRIV